MEGLGDHREGSNAEGVRGHFAAVPTGVGEEHLRVGLGELGVVVLQQARDATAESLEEATVPMPPLAEGDPRRSTKRVGEISGGHAVLEVPGRQGAQAVGPVELLRLAQGGGYMSEFGFLNRYFGDVPGANPHNFNGFQTDWRSFQVSLSFSGLSGQLEEAIVPKGQLGEVPHHGTSD